MKKPELSIITISYNTRQILLSCLDSIIKFTKGIDYEIIVVDNGSKDGSVDALKKYSKANPRVRLIDANENLGFGKGNNLGVKNSQGDFLLFLNSDTIIFDNVISNSLKKLKSHKKVGAFSCKLLNTDKTFQASGGHFPNLGNLFAWQFFVDDLPVIGNLIPSFHPQKSAYDNNQKLDWVTGAYMMVSKKAFEKAGGFDETIFMYTEEMELCYRLSDLGYKTLYDPEDAIIHLGGASGGSFLALTSEIKNMIYFWSKHKLHWQLPLVKFAFFIGSLLRLVIFGIIKGDEKARRAYSHALKLCL